MVGLSEAAVSGLVSDGVLTRGETMGEWLLAYIDRLREVAAGRMASGGLDLATERARLAAEQADRIAMQNAVTRKELAPVALIEQVLTGAAGRIVGILDAIPGAVRRRLPQLTSLDIDMVAAEVAKARNTVASMSLADLAAPDQADGGERDEPVGAGVEEGGVGPF